MPSPESGKLVAWKADKGYGFIRPEDGGKDVFVHLRDFGRIARAPRVGDVIHFQRIGDGTGRFRATDVSVAGLVRDASRALRPAEAVRRARRPAGAARPTRKAWRWVVVTLFAAVLIAALVFTRLHPGIVAAYLVASPVAWLQFAFDKAAAMNGRWRTSEATLLIVALLGGWPGALVAQDMFHHKSRKIAFLVPFWITVILNCAALAWACSGFGGN